MKVSQEKVLQIRASLHLSDEQIAKDVGLGVKTVTKIREKVESQEVNAPQPRVGDLDVKGRAVSLTKAQSVKNDEVAKRARDANRSMSGTIMDGISVIDPTKGVH